MTSLSPVWKPSGRQRRRSIRIIASTASTRRLQHRPMPIRILNQCRNSRAMPRYARMARERLEGFVADPQPTRPIPCADCGLCRWGDHCADVWDAEDSLFKVALCRAQALAISSVNDQWGVFSRSRVQLLPHQLWVCRQVTREWPIRWLVADDVGLPDAWMPAVHEALRAFVELPTESGPSRSSLQLRKSMGSSRSLAAAPEYMPTDGMQRIAEIVATAQAAVKGSLH